MKAARIAPLAALASGNGGRSVWWPSITAVALCGVDGHAQRGKPLQLTIERGVVDDPASSLPDGEPAENTLALEMARHPLPQPERSRLVDAGSAELIAVSANGARYALAVGVDVGGTLWVAENQATRRASGVVSSRALSRARR